MNFVGEGEEVSEKKERLGEKLSVWESASVVGEGVIGSISGQRTNLP